MMLELIVKYDKRDFFGHFMFTEDAYTITVQEEQEKKYITKALKKVISEDFTLQITRYNDLQSLIINKEFINRYAGNDKIQVRHYIKNNDYSDIVLSLKETRKYIKDFIQEVTA